MQLNQQNAFCKPENSRSRKERLQQIRDAALKLIEKHGAWKQCSTLRCKWAEVERLKFLHRTPFSGKPSAPSEYAKYLRALHGGPPTENLPYGLDIWAEGIGKVLNLEWGLNGELEVIGFRRGEWETDLLKLAGVEQQPRPFRLVDGGLAR